MVEEAAKAGHGVCWVSRAHLQGIPAVQEGRRGEVVHYKQDWLRA